MESLVNNRQCSVCFKSLAGIDIWMDMSKNCVYLSNTKVGFDSLCKCNNRIDI